MIIPHPAKDVYFINALNHTYSNQSTTFPHSAFFFTTLPPSFSQEKLLGSFHHFTGFLAHDVQYANLWGETI
jgi:hypothetical protein